VTGAIRASGADEGVRLRLIIREPRLAQIPWEFTYLSSLGHEHISDFLVLDPKVSLVRHEALPVPHSAVAARDPGRLRLIAATANAPGLATLDLRREWQVVERAVKDLPQDGAAIDYQPVLENPRVADLQGALLRGADLFHFAGHGGLAHGSGYLALPAEEADAVERLSADRLANLLRQAGVRVAVLGACESGRRDGISPWDGVATALVGAQVAAVVAMQYRIRDSSAIKFARALYTALAVGLSIDEAVAAGRLAVYDPDDLSSSWGIPVLYSRSPDGLIFSHLNERESASADALRTSVQMVVERIASGGSVVGIGLARVAGGRIDVSMKADTVEGEMIGIKDLQIGSRPPRQPGDRE
jgi:CHAT domain